MIDFAKKVMDAPLGVTHLFWVGQAGFIIKSADGRVRGTSRGTCGLSSSDASNSGL